MPVRVPALLAALACALTLVPAAAAAAQAPAPGDRAELIVRRDAGLSAAERRAVRTGAGVSHERGLLLADAEVVSVPATAADAALAELRADPDVRWAVPNATLHATATTCGSRLGVSQPACASDTYLPLQWALNNSGQTLRYDDGGGIVSDTGTPDADLDVFEAWGLGVTGAGVDVAVIDTGVNAAHPDLAGHLVPGWDFVEGDSNPQDENGHGTHVLGTIVAANGNGIGVSGVAPDARAMPLRALDANGDGSFEDILDAMTYAGAHGVRVVNLSLGGETSGAVASAAADVASDYPDTIFLAAAGNDTLDLETTTYTPCEAPADNVVCVGATDNDDAIAWFSNYGTTAVDLYAPGDLIQGPYGNGYGLLSGTSMATPNVAGVAALMLQRSPDSDGATLAQTLRETTDPKPGLPSVTGGRANAHAALAALGADTPVTPVDDPDAGDDGDGSSTTGTGDDTGGDTSGGATPDPVVLPVAAPVFTAPPAAPTTPAATTRTTTAAPTGTTADPARVRALAVKVTRRRARLTITTSSATTAQVVLQRRVCGKGRCRWTGAFRTTRTVAAGRTVYTATKRLARGKYRATVTPAGGAARTASFTVA